MCNIIYSSQLWLIQMATLRTIQLGDQLNISMVIRAKVGDNAQPSEGQRSYKASNIRWYRALCPRTFAPAVAGALGSDWGQHCWGDHAGPACVCLRVILLHGSDEVRSAVHHKRGHRSAPINTGSPPSFFQTTTHRITPVLENDSFHWLVLHAALSQGRIDKYCTWHKIAVDEYIFNCVRLGILLVLLAASAVEHVWFREMRQMEVLAHHRGWLSCELLKSMIFPHSASGSCESIPSEDCPISWLLKPNLLIALLRPTDGVCWGCDGCEHCEKLSFMLSLALNR